MTNKQIARRLHAVAELIELTGGGAFRARAYENAAGTIDRLDTPIAALLASGELTRQRGIGKGIAAQVQELVEQGRLSLLDELRAALPPGLLDVLQVRGLGARRVRRLWQELRVTSLEELEAAAVEGRLAALEGFGEKSQAQVLEETRQLRIYRARRRYPAASQAVQPVLERLRRLEGIERVEPTGELRRGMETIGAAELIARVRPEARAGLLEVLQAFSAPMPDPVPAGAFFTGRLPDGQPLVVYAAAPEEFGSRWWQSTGSAEHVAAFVKAFGEPEPAADEDTVYTRVGLRFIPPELREDRGELEAAQAGALPRLIELRDLHGTLHNHSTYSDGAHAIRQMAEAARAMRLSYFGLCDHSQSLTIAGGLSVERVRAQQREIAALNAAFAEDGGPPFRIFSGTESDILPDGRLDYPDEVLASFDFVVASVHQGFTMTREEATARILRAVENPYTTILGHPTGRLLLAREGYPIDHMRVIAACAAHGVVLELNANARRLDLDWRWIREATDRGVSIAINPDAHSVEDLHNTEWGVRIARKGWLTPDQCLNALPLPAFEAWIDARRQTRTGETSNRPTR